MTPDQKKTYTRWKQLVNMSRSELQSFYDSKEGKEAGLKPKEASKQGIHYGRESARWILKMKATPVEDWTETMWKWAGRQISFISRMSKAKGELIDDKGNKTRKYLSLLIWGHDPKKMKAGGRLQQGEKNAKQTDDLLYNFEEDQIIGNQSDAAGQVMEKGGETNASKMFSAASRFKPKETIIFDPEIVGVNGNKLISYTWAYEWTMLPNWEGELVDKRVSDWSQAEMSADTGKNIVHQFTVQTNEGYKTVSAESVPILLGYVDRKQMKSLPTLTTAAKTLAKQKLQLAILEAKKAEYDEAKKEIITDGFPEIVKGTIEDLGIGYKESIASGKMKESDLPTVWKMGNIKVLQIDAGLTPSQERVEMLKSSYINDKLRERGINPYSANPISQIRELKDRIARQERKLNQILTADKMEKGGKLPALKKPKSIVTIAKQQKVALKYAMNQLMAGIKVESEHTKDKNVAKTIALHHLDENIHYYEALKKMETNLDKGKFAKGGTVYGDGKHSKDAKDGGYFKGNSHAEGGIKAVVKDTGQVVEVEGNEIIINKRSVADNTKREFEGELLTNREILSRINQSGGGVAFADGGEVPETISVTGKQYKIGGELVKDSDFVHSCGCKHKMQEGGEVDLKKTFVSRRYDSGGNAGSNSSMYARYAGGGKLYDTKIYDRGGVIKSIQKYKDSTIDSRYDFENARQEYGYKVELEDGRNWIGYAVDRADAKRQAKEYFGIKDGKLQLSDIPAEVKKFMPEMQQKAIVGTEELWDVLARLEDVINRMPKTYETEKIPADDKIVYLHYFYGQSDWYIVEKDMYPDQKQAFGYVILNGFVEDAEWGYISIEEIKSTNKIELDFYFEPIRFGDLKKKWMDDEDEGEKQKDLQSDISKAHDQLSYRIEMAQNNYDDLLKKKQEYIRQNGYPTGFVREYDVDIVSKLNDAEVMLNQLKNAKDNLLQEPVMEVKEEAVENLSEPINLQKDMNVIDLSPYRGKGMTPSLSVKAFQRDENGDRIMFTQYTPSNHMMYISDSAERNKFADNHNEALKLGYKVIPYKAGDYGQVYVYEKDGKALSEKAFNGLSEQNIPEPAPAQPEKEVALTEKFKNASQVQINNEIRTIIGQKGLDKSRYSADELSFIQLYEGGGAEKKVSSDKSILTQFFTPESIIAKMWGLAFKYGFTFDNTHVLEPSFGSGRFFKYIPKDAKVSVTGYEIEPVAYKIGQLLYGHDDPRYSLRFASFETMFFDGRRHTGMARVEKLYDLVITNPPYADYVSEYAPLGEREATGAFTFEMYFIMRGVDLLKKGGLLIYIIPNTFLSNDNKYNAFKEKLSQKCDLIDAYRLPNGVFDNTEVGTDIIVLKKK